MHDRLKIALPFAAAGCLGGLLAAGQQPATPGFYAVSAGLSRAVHSGGADKTHIRQSLGQGACWLDIDNDRDPDLYVPSGPASLHDKNAAASADTLYRNDGGRFEAVAEIGESWSVGCAVADINADGWLDVYVTTASGPDRILINTGRGGFEDRTEELGPAEDSLSASAAFGDLDGDGDPDLVVTTYLDESSRPSGDCRWQGVSVMCGPRGFAMGQARAYRNDRGRLVRTDALAEVRGFGLGVLLLDLDEDADLDVFIANDSSPNHLFINERDWRFVEAGLTRGVAHGPTGANQAGMGVDAGDLDGDGREDIVVTNFAHDTHNVYTQLAEGYFVDTVSQSGLAGPSFNALGWSVLLEDFDLDGALDILVVNSHVYPEVAQVGQAYQQRVQLFINRGDGRFEERPDLFGSVAATPMVARGAAAADYDGDGDMDVVVVRDGAAPLLFENRLTEAGGALKLQVARDATRDWQGLRATAHHRSGRQQRRTLRRARGYLSSSEPVLVFGNPTHDPITGIVIERPRLDAAGYVRTRLSVEQVMAGPIEPGLL